MNKANNSDKGPMIVIKPMIMIIMNMNMIMDKIRYRFTFFFLVFILFVPFLLFLVGCGSDTEESSDNQDLGLGFELNASYVLPGKVKSCVEVTSESENSSGNNEGGGVSPPRIQYRGITIDWKKESKLTVVAIMLEFTSNKLKQETYNCSVDGEELHSLFEHDPNYSNGVISSSAKIVSNEKCYLHCGGFELNEEAPRPNSIYISGTATLLGYYTEEGLSVPIRTSTQVIVGY